jgi:outer membrane protein assembly factor BamA
MAAIGGAATGNGTWGLFGGYSAWWLDNRLQTKIGGGYGLVNLDYHGLGDNSLSDHPVGYTLKPLGGLVEARYRLGQSPWLAGLGYTFAETRVSFDNGVLPPGINLPSLDSHVGGFKPVVAFDTRNNIFTPTQGIYAEITGGLYSQAFAGDNDFQTISPVFIYYLPLAPKWTLGVNATAGFSFGDAPFYMRPSISLRGAPAREYQAENISQIEAELRWQFWKRFSLVGFAGTGVAWNNFEHFDSKRELVTGGTGFRYELARKYGLHMGADVAFGPDGAAVYIQFGSAWFRP